MGCKAELDVDGLLSMTLPPGLVLGAFPKWISESRYPAISPPPGLEPMFPSCDDWNKEPKELATDQTKSEIGGKCATGESHPGFDTEVFTGEVGGIGMLAVEECLPKTAVRGDSGVPFAGPIHGQKKRFGRGRGGRGGGSNNGVRIGGNSAFAQPCSVLFKGGGCADGVSSVRSALRERGERVLAELTNAMLQPAPLQMPIPRLRGAPACAGLETEMAMCTSATFYS